MTHIPPWFERAPVEDPESPQLRYITGPLTVQDTQIHTNEDRGS